MKMKKNKLDVWTEPPYKLGMIIFWIVLLIAIVMLIYAIVNKCVSISC